MTSSSQIGSSPSGAGAPSAVSIARTFSEVEEIAAAWRSPPSTPASDLDYYRAAAEWTPGFLRPHVMLIRAAGTPPMLVAARLEEASLRVRIGFRRVLLPRSRCLVVEPGGIAGDLSEAACRAVIASLQDSLRRGEADVAILREIPRSSVLFRSARHSLPRRCRDGAPSTSVRWVLPLPSSPDAPLPLSSHTRKLSRYYMNRLRRRYGERLRIEPFRCVSELDRMMIDVEAVAEKTYQRRLGVGFSPDESTRRRIRHQMERGWFRSFVLYIDDRPRAFWLGLRYGDTYYAKMTGYDPASHADHVGKVLLAWMLEALRQEGGLRRVDFGFGDADYKHHWATEQIEEATVALFAPSARGLLLNSMRTAFGTAERLSRLTVTRLGLLEPIRTHLRRRTLDDTHSAGGVQGSAPRQGRPTRR